MLQGWQNLSLWRRIAELGVGGEQLAANAFGNWEN